MRPFLPTIISTAAVLSIPCTNAFVTPSTTNNVVGGVISERYTSSQITAIKSDTLNDADVPSHILHKSITSTLAAATILLGTVSPAFAVSGGGLDFAGTNISEKDFSSQSKYVELLVDLCILAYDMYLTYMLLFDIKHWYYMH